jgi:pimeloyl-ACP methyl ester carboxylesterase
MIVAPAAHVVTLRDGRALSWAEMGDPDGSAVLFFHGTPGSRHQVLVDDAPFRAAGFRCIAPDRPGYGGSAFAAGRRLTDWADDVRELADHLEVERFAVLGMSGGGPHAAACAHGLSDRVTGLGLLSSVGPLERRGSEAGMMPVNRLFTRLARRVPSVNRIPFGAMARVGRRIPDRMLAQVRTMAPAPDAQALSRPEAAAAMRRDLAEASRTSGRAAAQDFELFARDWGFRLEEVAVPTDVWQAEADVNVPVAHARALASAIPGATLHLLPDEGHFMAFAHMDEILAALRSGPPA